MQQFTVTVRRTINLVQELTISATDADVASAIVQADIDRADNGEPTKLIKMEQEHWDLEDDEIEIDMVED